MMQSKPIVWFSIIFSLSLAVGLLAGKSVQAAFRSAPPGSAADPAGQAVEQSLDEPVESAPLLVEVQEPKVPASPVDAAPAEAGTERILKFNQHNLLILQVDDLKSHQPRLQSMWLAIHLPEMGQVMLLPLYPDTRNTNGSELADALRAILEMPSPVAADGNPPPELLTSLEAAGLWWHHTLVLDQVALIELLGAHYSITGTASEAGAALDPLQEVAALAAREDDSDAYLRASASLYQQICWVWASGTTPRPDIAEISAFSPQHLKTNLPTAPAAVSTDETQPAAANIQCQFPSLADSADRPSE